VTPDATGATSVTTDIAAVTRTVGGRTLPAGEARVVTVSRHYPVAPEDLWDACTNPERLPRWFLPVTGDLRVGGRYQLQGNAGGVVERCDPPRSFAVTWEFGEGVGGVAVTLTPETGGTRFTLEHVGHVDDAFWDEFGPGAVGVGWDGAVLGLGRHLAGGAGPSPDELEAWSAGPGGRAFYTAAADAWCAAHVAAGGDPEHARAAADRTTAFYTGSPTGAVDHPR
jgi:uncharacterized protein YndB with AHSA1/START domain